jgi:hypothetical protein
MQIVFNKTRPDYSWRAILGHLLQVDSSAVSLKTWSLNTWLLLKIQWYACKQRGLSEAPYPCERYRVDTAAPTTPHLIPMTKTTCDHPPHPVIPRTLLWFRVSSGKTELPASLMQRYLKNSSLSPINTMESVTYGMLSALWTAKAIPTQKMAWIRKATPIGLLFSRFPKSDTFPSLLSCYISISYQPKNPVFDNIFSISPINSDK